MHKIAENSLPHWHIKGIVDVEFKKGECEQGGFSVKFNQTYNQHTYIILY